MQGLLVLVAPAIWILAKQNMLHAQCFSPLYSTDSSLDTIFFTSLINKHKNCNHCCRGTYTEQFSTSSSRFTTLNLVLKKTQTSNKKISQKSERCRDGGGKQSAQTCMDSITLSHITKHSKNINFGPSGVYDDCSHLEAFGRP